MSSGSYTDPNLRWVAEYSPEFHPELMSHIPPSLLSSDAAAENNDSDSDSDSDGSDSDSDPYDPSNFHDPAKKWVRNGDFVYEAEDGLNINFLDASTQNDVPYNPPAEPPAPKGPLCLSPAELGPPASPFLQPFVFRHAPPQPDQHTVSPLDIAPSSFPPTPARRTSPLPPLPSSARSTRRAALDMSRLYTLDPDSDPESAGGDDGSEDEYVPSPRARARKSHGSTSRARNGATSTRTPRHAYSPYPASSSAGSSSSSAAGTSSAIAASRRAGSRNVQIVGTAPPPRGAWARTGPNAYKCPYCAHVQANKRSPDLERHIRSHFRRSAGERWVCCGLPPAEAAERGVGPGSNPWTFNGVRMVGGCHMDFSRMDALKRHIDNGNNRCVGDTKYAKREE